MKEKEKWNHTQTCTCTCMHALMCVHTHTHTHTKWFGCPIGNFNRCLSYRFLEGGVKDRVEDIARVVHRPELAEDSGPDWSDMDVGEEVAEEAAQLLIQLAPGADGVALPVQVQCHILWKKG